ncbi:MAG: 5'-nucleotidase C-terminal domain-containing protein [Flavobacteriales bacterium]|nr:5'-nucleotidase C-terminal domain-containing protein [Flavobacteriales bacterium]
MRKNNLYILYSITLLLFSCSNVKILSVTESNIQLTDSIKDISSEISELIAPYRDELNKSINEILNLSAVAMQKPERYDHEAQAQNLLGNFVADLSFTIGKELYAPKDGKSIDFCVLNNGGLRTSLPKGEITRKKVFELMPFENELVVLTLSGRTTKKLLDYIVSLQGVPMSNLTIVIQQKELKTALVGEFPFDTAKTYKVITSDYLARGGDKMNFFSENLNYEPVGIKLRDAIIKYIEDEKTEGRVITSSLDKRMTIIE